MMYNMNQPYVCIYPPPLGPSSHPDPHTTPLCQHRALGCASYPIGQLPTSHLLYTRECINVSATLSVHPTFSFPGCVHKSVVCVCVFVTTQQTALRCPFILDICFCRIIEY